MRTALALLLLLLRVTAAGADIAHEMRALVRDTLDAHTVDEPRTVISKQHDLSPQGLADGDPDDEDEQEEVIVVVNSISDSTTGRCPKRQKRAKGACTLHAAINKGLRLDKNLRPTISLLAGRIAISKALAVIDSNMAIIGVGERIQVAREDDGSLSTNVPNGIAFSPRSELDGRNRHRHFAVAPLAALIAENLTLRRGMANGVGGSIKNEGTVQLINILITQNAAGHGGAIYNEGILHAYLASGTHNRASFCGGVLYVAQGGHTSLHGCAFDQNTELDCVRQAHSTSSIASATPASVSLVHDEFSGENYDVVGVIFTGPPLNSK